MKKFNVYNVYLDDGQDCYKVTVPAESRRDAEHYCEGNGEIIAVKDSELQDICVEALADTLRNSGWGKTEIDIITRTLIQCGLQRV